MIIRFEIKDLGEGTFFAPRGHEFFLTLRHPINYKEIYYWSGQDC
jgi:hypothetical protein